MLSTSPTRTCTIAEIFRPSTRARRWCFDISTVFAGSVLIALSAWLEIRLPFSIVPVTGQTFAVLLVGALLGPKLGVAAVVTYLAQGAAGLPVFAGGAGGFAWMLGPTGGYLAGFVPAAFIVGWLAQRGWDRTPLRTALAMTIGNAAIYIVGLPWLALFVSTAQAIAQGLVPFLPGAALKIALATALLPIGWRMLALMPLNDTASRQR